MPLNQAQKDAIAKINGGADILAIIDADETEHLTFADTNKDLTAKLKETETKNRALTKEQVARKRAMQNVQETAKAHGLELFGGEFGLEPPTPLEEQFAAVLTKSDTVTKDTVVKNPEYLKLSKELEQMKRKERPRKSKRQKKKKQRKPRRGVPHCSRSLWKISVTWRRMSWMLFSQNRYQSTRRARIASKTATRLFR